MATGQTNQSYAGGGMDADYEENINWDTVGGTTPVGKYDFEVVKAEYKPTKEKKHMVSVQFKVINAYDPETAELAKDRSVFENFVFTAAAAFRVKDFMKACDIEPPPTISKTILNEWCEGIVGMQVGANVTHREFQGENRANLQKFFPVGTGGDEASDDASEEEDEDEDKDEEEEEETAQAGGDDDEEEEAAPAPKQGIRAAVAAQKANGANGTAKHTNGTNGAAKVASGKPVQKIKKK